MNNNTFWGRAKPLIKAHNLSQKQFADRMKIPYGTLKTWLFQNRTPDIDAAYAIAYALGVTLDYLMSGKDKNITELRLKEIEARKALGRIQRQLDKMQEELRKMRPL